MPCPGAHGLAQKPASAFEGRPARGSPRLLRAARGLTASEFHEMVEKEGASYTIFVNAGVVCKLPRQFEHPGGAAVLRELHGRDATELIEEAHRTDSRVQKLIARCGWVRLVDDMTRAPDPDALVPEVDRSLRALRRSLEERGLFRLTNSGACVRAAEPLAIVALSMWALHLVLSTAPPFSSLAAALAAALAVLGYLRMLWFAHDAQHHSLFPDGRTADLVVDWISFVFFGYFTIKAWRAHSVHHAFPNALDFDWTNLHVFQVAPQHAGRSSKAFVRVQWVFWYGVALPCFGLIKLCEATKQALGQGWWWRLALMAARPPLLLATLGGPLGWAAVLLPFVAAGLLAYVSQLNHLHMPKVDTPAGWAQHAGQQAKSRRAGAELCDSFVWAMAVPSCNLYGGPLFGYLVGGLHLHIEHHLFPTLPSNRLPAVQGHVRELLAEHGVPYYGLPVCDAVRENFEQMRRPGRSIALPCMAN